MNVTEKIMLQIIKDQREWDKEIPEPTSENVREIYKEYCKWNESEQEFRGNYTHETNLPSQWSRHYEAKEVATQLDDGTWVGWTYWYGGGKHGDPQSIDWISDAYELEMREETRIVKVFSKK